MKYIILLRGINVSGKNKLPMADLRELLLNLGFQNIQTYIQSGNIVLQSDKSKNEVSQVIQQEIKAQFDYDIPVLVKTAKDWQKAIDNNPFKDVEERQQYFTFLSDVPTEINIKIEVKKDEFKIIKDVVYLNVVGGYGKTKLTNNLFEQKLKVTATTRNLKTTLKMLEMTI